MNKRKSHVPRILVIVWRGWRTQALGTRLRRGAKHQNMAGIFVARRLFRPRFSPVLCRRVSSFFTDEYTPPQLDHVTRDWDKLYQQSIRDPETFWGQLGATRLAWMKPFDSVMDVDLDKGQHKWFLGGKLNVSGRFLVDIVLLGARLTLLSKKDALFRSKGGEGVRMFYISSQIRDRDALLLSTS